MAEPTKMPFRMLFWVGTRNDVLDRDPDRTQELAILRVKGVRPAYVRTCAVVNILKETQQGENLYNVDVDWAINKRQFPYLLT